MPRGTITIAKVGVAIMITIIALITLKTQRMKFRTEKGMTSSMVLMSFEKRLRTRPRGVVSKNDMGDLRMFLSILE